MPVTYTSGELRLSGTVTNTEFFNATSTAGLTRNSENQYALTANMRIMSGADLSGLGNFILALNTFEIYSEHASPELKQITFIESDGRTTADRVVFKTASGGETPVLTECQFLHNIVGNPGGGDPRYLTMVHMTGAANTVFRASDFSEQEIDGVQLMKSGVYRGIAGNRVKRFIASQDSSGTAVRVILKDIKQSSKLYQQGGIVGVYNGASMMVSNWELEQLNAAATNTWLDNYNGHLGNHWVYLLGTAADAYQSNGAGISQKKDQLHVVTGGHKYFHFQGANGGKFAYFDSRSATTPQKCIPVTTTADMLSTSTVVSIDSTEKVEFITHSMTYNKDSGSWAETNITGQRIRVRAYGKQEVNQTFSDAEAVEGTPESYAPFVMLDDAGITESTVATVAAYTGCSISGDTITLSSGTWNPDKLYDYVRYWLTQNVGVANFFHLNGSVVLSDYKLVVNTPAVFEINRNTKDLEFSSSCGTPALTGTGWFNLGTAVSQNGVTSYDDVAIKFHNVGNSWYQNSVYNITGTTVMDGVTFDILRPVITGSSVNMIINKGTFKVGAHSLSSPYEINFGSAGITLNDFTIDGRGTFIITDDVSINKFTGRNYDGIFPAGKFRAAGTDFLEVNDYQGVGSYNDHTLWRRNRIKWINSVDGTNVKVLGKETGSSAQHTGISEFWSRIKLHVTDAANNPQEGVRFAARDYNDGNRSDTSSLTGSATSGHYNTGFDYTPDRTYSGVTDSDGYTPDIDVLIGVVDRHTGGAQATPASAWSYRGKNGDNSDEFEFYVWQYGRNMASINMSMKGAGVKEGKIVTTPDINISEQDATVVAAYQGISIDHNTRTITLTAQRTLGEIYDYMVYDKTTASGIFKPTIATKVPTIVGATIDIGDYNLIVDGCDVSAGDTGFALLQTTGLITLQNGATIDFNFIDAIGNAIVNIDVPVNWTLEGVYPTQNDAMNQTNKKTNSAVNYKYLTTSDGGDTIWFRVEDGDGQGVGFDSFLLPSARGVYGTAAITTTEDSLLNQIRAIVRDTQNTVNEVSEDTGGGLSKEYFDDFQVRTGYSLASVAENTVPNTAGHSLIYRQVAGKIAGSSVDVRGSVLSKVKFYVGLEQIRSTNAFVNGTVKFKIWKYKASGNQVPSVGDLLWESSEVNLADLVTAETWESAGADRRAYLKESQEYNVASEAIIVSDELIVGYEVISGSALHMMDATSTVTPYYSYYWSETRIDGWTDNSPGYIRASNLLGVGKISGTRLDITKYDYDSVDSQKLKADVSDIKLKTDQLEFTEERVDANIPDQLTETEFDAKNISVTPSGKGWQ